MQLIQGTSLAIPSTHYTFAQNVGVFCNAEGVFEFEDDAQAAIDDAAQRGFIAAQTGERNTLEINEAVPPPPHDPPPPGVGE